MLVYQSNTSVHYTEAASEMKLYPKSKSYITYIQSQLKNNLKYWILVTFLELILIHSKNSHLQSQVLTW